MTDLLLLFRKPHDDGLFKILTYESLTVTLNLWYFLGCLNNMIWTKYSRHQKFIPLSFLLQQLSLDEKICLVNAFVVETVKCLFLFLFSFLITVKLIF